MKVLIACEESQAVCLAFRAKGHEAFSCDLQECSGGYPEWHIIADAIETAYSEVWDLMVAHPPCTFLSRAGMAHKAKSKEVKEFREQEAKKAIEFIKQLWNAPIDKICIENPVGVVNTHWRKPTQIIHPYYFGDPEMKETCLWLKRLPRLNGLHTIDKIIHKPKPIRSRIGSDGKMKNMYFCGLMDNKSNAAKLKSKTFPSIAKAMAEQWG
jgi:hypothetical protein